MATLTFCGIVIIVYPPFLPSGISVAKAMSRRYNVIGIYDCPSANVAAPFSNRHLDTNGIITESYLTQNVSSYLR